MNSKAAKETLDLLEKLTSFPYFLFVLSVVLFTDTYLLAAHGISIRNTDETWLKTHSNINEMITFLGCVGFFYAAFIPGLRFFVNFIQIFFPNRKYPSEKDGWVRRSILRDFAIVNNNPLAYKEYENSIELLRTERRTSVLCLSLAFLSVADYSLSSENYQSLLQFIYLNFNAFPWYVHFPLMIVVIPFLIFVLIVAFRTDAQYDDHVFLPDFKHWPRKDNE